MDAPFDAYHKWLGIPPEQQPPDHYRLLGLRPFENDDEVIDNAAEARMLLLRTRQTGPNAEACHRLLNELAAARHCLLDHAARERYNAQLREAAIESALLVAPPLPGLRKEEREVLPGPPPAHDENSSNDAAKPTSRPQKVAGAPRVPMGMPTEVPRPLSQSADDDQDDEGEWHILTASGEYFGRAAVGELKKLAVLGHVMPDFKLAKGGSDRWIRADELLDEFAPPAGEPADAVSPNAGSGVTWGAPLLVAITVASVPLLAFTSAGHPGTGVVCGLVSLAIMLAGAAVASGLDKKMKQRSKDSR